MDWLESHKKVTKLEQELNAEAGKVTNLQYDLPGKWANKPKRTMLPKKVQLFLDRDMCEYNLEKEILRHGAWYR